MYLDVIGPTPVEDVVFGVASILPYFIIGLLAIAGFYALFRAVKKKTLARIMYGKRGK